MNSKDFCIWLSGYFEVQDPKSIDLNQINIIREHLELALKSNVEFRLDNKVRAANC